MALVLGVFIFKIYEDIVAQLPNTNERRVSPLASQVFDSENNLIGQFIFEDRIPVHLDQVSVPFRTTIIASEDERFTMHKGFDLRSIFRALFANISTGSMSQGGSTITQQVARSSIYLQTQELSITRKIREIVLAYKLEENYSKDEILQFYLNEIFFGFGSYGVEAAARNYFGKTAKELDFAESTLLVAILPAPSVDNPIVNLPGTKERQKNVLRKLVQQGKISQEEADKYFAVPYQRKSFRQAGDDDSVNYFIDYIRTEMEQKYHNDLKLLQTGGFKIFTTINLNYQRYAEKAIKGIVSVAEKKKQFKTDFFDKLGVKQPQACLVAINPKNGYILAMIGGRDYRNAQWNRVTAERHPGSSFKIFDYSAAFENKSVTPGSLLVSDYQFNIGGWNPEEWKGSPFGILTTRLALINSSNICALRASLRVGVDRVAYFAAKMGLKTPIPPYPAITVGSIEVRPIDMCTAYSCLASGGYRRDPVAIIKVENKDGVTIFKHADQPIKVLTEQTTFILTSIFQDVLHSILGSQVKTTAAGKTGTSTNALNGWYCCFTPEITVVSYYGVDEEKLKGAVRTTGWGSAFAAPTCKDFINMCLLDKKNPLPKTPFPKAPKGIGGATICKTSGQLASIFCPKDQVIGEYFFAGTAPDVECQYHLELFEYYNVFVEKESDGNEILYKAGSWCPTEPRKLAKTKYLSLPTKECEPPIDITLNNWPLEDTTITKGVTSNLTVTVKPEYLTKINEVRVYWNDIQLAKFQHGGANDTGGTIDLSQTQKTDLYVPPDYDKAEGTLWFELFGPDNYLLQKTFKVKVQ